MQELVLGRLKFNPETGASGAPNEPQAQQTDLPSPETPQTPEPDPHAQAPAKPVPFPHQDPDAMDSLVSKITSQLEQEQQPAPAAPAEPDAAPAPELVDPLAGEVKQDAPPSEGNAPALVDPLASKPAVDPTLEVINNLNAQYHAETDPDRKARLAGMIQAYYGGQQVQPAAPAAAPEAQPAPAKPEVDEKTKIAYTRFYQAATQDVRAFGNLEKNGNVTNLIVKAFKGEPDLYDIPEGGTENEVAAVKAKNERILAAVAQLRQQAYSAADADLTRRELDEIKKSNEEREKREAEARAQEEFYNKAATFIRDYAKQVSRTDVLENPEAHKLMNDIYEELDKTAPRHIKAEQILQSAFVRTVQEIDKKKLEPSTKDVDKQPNTNANNNPAPAQTRIPTSFGPSGSTQQANVISEGMQDRPSYKALSSSEKQKAIAAKYAGQFKGT